MYINALLKRGGIFAGHLETEKCKTCFEKALAIDANCIDVFIHRARVSIVDQIVNAAALFRDGNYQDVIKLLTAAIDEGMGTLICYMFMFAGGVRVRVWIREQRKIKRRSKALLSL